MARTKGSKNGSGCLYKRGTTYWYAYGGERASTGCKNEREARKYLANKIAELNAKVNAVKDQQKLEGAFDKFMALVGAEKAMSKSLSQAYQRYWLRFCEFARTKGIDDLSEITPVVAKEYVASLVDMPPSTLEKYIYSMRSIYRTVLPDNKNPFVGIRPKVISTGHTMHYGRIDARDIPLLCATASMRDKELGVLFTLASQTGLRLKDAVLLKRSQVDFRTRMITLVPAKTQHYETVCRIPMSDELWDMLKAIAAKWDTEQEALDKAIYGKDADDGYFLPNLAKRYAKSRTHLKSAIAGVFAKAGVPYGKVTHNGKTYKNSFHSLRVSYISQMAESGCPLAVLIRIVGHTDIEQTLAYYRADDAIMLEAVRKAFPEPELTNPNV